MKTIKIQLTDYQIDQRPTTQEDNFGQISERWDLFQNNKMVGKLVKYFNGCFAAFHEPCIRYDFKSTDIQFVN